MAEPADNELKPLIFDIGSDMAKVNAAQRSSSSSSSSSMHVTHWLSAEFVTHSLCLACAHCTSAASGTTTYLAASSTRWRLDGFIAGP
jgi:hypothetical protein